MANENYKLVIDVDNRDEILGELDEAIDRALESVGMAASDYAAAKCPVDTGLLRNSITYALHGKEAAIASYESNETSKRTGKTIKKETGSYSGTAPDDEKAVYVGTNVEYAAYVEYGDSGGTPRPFLKPAIMDHKDEYKRLAEDALKGFGN
jgi:phage gpG-like protein